MPKKYDSIIDNILDERAPNYKELDLAEAKSSGDEQLARTHNFVDADFIDEIAKAAGFKEELVEDWCPQCYGEEPDVTDCSHCGGNGTDPKGRKVKPDSRTIEQRERTKNGSFLDESLSVLTASTENWRKDAARVEKFDADTQSVLDEVTMSLDAANKDGKLEKKEWSDGEVQAYIKNLLNQGVPPIKIATKLKHLADLEIFDHGMADDYLKRNSGTLGLAYLEPSAFQDKQNPKYQHNASSNDCVRQSNAFKQAGITVRAKSVRQISACEGCSYFKKNASDKTCSLYGLPIVSNKKELTSVINKLTAGVPQQSKKAALVQIANRQEERVQTPTNPFANARVASESTASMKEAPLKKVTPKRIEASHYAKLHEKGVSLAKIHTWASNKFSPMDASQALRGFVSSLKKDDTGKIVIASQDVKFLTSVGIRNESFQASKKCASCTAHFSKEVTTPKGPEGVSRVEQKFAQISPDATRTKTKQASAVFTAATVEKLHTAGHSMEKIFKAGAKKVGSANAGKAVRQFVDGIKKGNTKIALSQIDCTFLKGKLGVQNAIVGAPKCATCTFRKDMHCGLTGGTLLSYPGMYEANKHKNASQPTFDGHQVLGEYDLINTAPQDDIDTSGHKLEDIEMDATHKLEVE
jgi:hypothetical protein